MTDLGLSSDDDRVKLTPNDRALTWFCRWAELSGFRELETKEAIRLSEMPVSSFYQAARRLKKLRRGETRFIVYERNHREPDDDPDEYNLTRPPRNLEQTPLENPSRAGS